MNEKDQIYYTQEELKACLAGKDLKVFGEVNTYQQVIKGIVTRTPEEIAELRTAISTDGIDPDRLSPEFEADPAPEDTRR